MEEGACRGLRRSVILVWGLVICGNLWEDVMSRIGSHRSLSTTGAAEAIGYRVSTSSIQLRICIFCLQHPKNVSK